MYTRVQMDIESLLRNCQDPVRCVGSWILSPNRASGVAALRSFRSKFGQPSKLWSREGLQSFYFNRTIRRCSLRHVIAQSHWYRRGGSSRKLRNKPRLMDPSTTSIYIPSLTDSHPLVDSFNETGWILRETRGGARTPRV